MNDQHRINANVDALMVALIRNALRMLQTDRSPEMQAQALMLAELGTQLRALGGDVTLRGSIQ